MRIKCPECRAVLNLGDAKPGSYKPTCKQCQKRFALIVTADDPPKVKLGRLVTASASKAPMQSALKRAAQVVVGVSAEVGAETLAGDTAQQVPRAESVRNFDETFETRSASDAATSGGSGCISDEATQDGVAIARAANTREKTKVSRGGALAVALQSPSLSKSNKAPETPAVAEPLGERLGNYKILRLLGRGAMGAVYEAKQLSLDRIVALKTMNPRIANNPASLARFTREAYAAAQLTHPNVVQIYDFGDDDGKVYFSMEWVRGGPLDELVRQKGKLDPKLAATYVLQAARGLQFAHQNGMVHRDVKPANILLSDQGVIKVADLGLVKIPDLPDPESTVGATSASASASMERSGSTDLTLHGSAVGTPAYMAPEQCVDASAVDHRADIYSLGCTLFYLLTGRPPFQAATATEVMQSHTREPVPNVTQLNSRAPERLNAIIQKSMLKRPADRYGSLAEMVTALESFLGLDGGRVFSPTSDQADRWEAIAADHRRVTAMRRLVMPAVLGGVVVAGLTLLLTPLVGMSWLLLGPSLLLGLFAMLLVFERGVVMGRVRTWVGAMSWFDLVVAVFGFAMALLVSVLGGFWTGVLVGGLLGAGLAAAIHFGIVVPTDKKSQPVIADAQKFVRDLRLAGGDENAIRTFTSTYGGKQWQSLHEQLFGYESMTAQREQLRSDRAFREPTKITLRDRVCQLIDAKVAAKRETRDQKRLAAIEEKGLQSEGLTAVEARDRAWQMAAAVMESSKVVASIELTPEAAAKLKREKQKTMLAEARSGNFGARRDLLAPVKWLLGGQTRLLMGCVLLGVFAVWGQGAGLFDSLQDLKEIDASSLTQGNFDSLKTIANQAGQAVSEVSQRETEPTMLGTAASPWSVGVAGLLLIVSALFSGWRITPLMVGVTLVVLLGSTLGIPSLGPWLPSWLLASAIGVVLTGLAIQLGRSPAT